MAKSILRNILIWTGITLGFLLGSLLIFLIVLNVFRIPIELDSVRGKVESAASAELGRDVVIDGSIKIIPSIWSDVEVSGVRIENPEGWNHDNFASIDYARVRVGIIQLIFGTIHLREVHLSGVEVRLEKKSDNEANWKFDRPNSKPEESSDRSKAGEKKSQAVIYVDYVEAHDAVLTYQNISNDSLYEIAVNELEGRALRDKTLELKADGSFQKQPFNLSLTGGGIEEILNRDNPWPFNLNGRIAGASITLDGSTNEFPRLKEIDTSFKISGDQASDLDAFFGPRFSTIGHYDLSGGFVRSDSEYKFNDLEGRLGKTQFKGDINFNTSKDDPSINGALVFDTLDPEPLDKIFRSNNDKPKNPDKDEENSESSFPLNGFLNRLYADVDVQIREIINMPVVIGDVSIKLGMENGSLSSPFSFNIADVALNGILDLNTQSGSPDINLDLKAEDSELSGLTNYLEQDGIEGSVDNFHLTVSGNGSDMDSLLENLDLQLQVKGLDFRRENKDSGSTGLYSIDTGGITLKQGKDLKGDIKGKLLDKPVSASFSGCGPSSFLKGNKCPVKLQARGAGANLDIIGSIDKNNGHLNTNLKTGLSGSYIGALYPWIDVSPSSQAPYNLSVNFKLTDKELHLDSIQCRIGDSAVSGEIGWKEIDKDPVLFATLISDVLDLSELITIFSSPVTDTKNNRVESDKTDIDIPILPKHFHYNNDDLDITIKRLILDSTEIKDISYTSSVRKGVVQESPFKATIGDTSFQGDFTLDFRTEVPTAHLELNSKSVNIGSLLEELNIADGVVSSAKNLSIRLELKGSKLSEILKNSELTAELEDGQWTIYDPNLGDVAHIRVKKSRLEASPLNKTKLFLEGFIEETPINIELQTEPLIILIEHNEKLPIVIKSEAAGVRIDLTGSHSFPLISSGMDFKISIKGDRLDSLDDLVGVELPPLGPFEIGGQFRMDSSGYYITDMDVLLGTSDLKGDWSLKTSGPKPFLEVDLVTKKLDLNDLDFDNWSPVDSETGDSSKSDKKPPVAKTGNEEGEVKPIISASVMQSHDAKFSLKAEEVYSGDIRLGSGVLEATLENGRLSTDLFELDLPGGLIESTFVIDVGGTDRLFEANIIVENFDYGILAKRLDPDTEMDGLIDLELKMESRAEAYDTIMSNANGNLNFIIWPGNYEAGVFDFWSLGLLTNLLPRWGGSTKSSVNCILGKIVILDGIAEPKKLIIDTTNVRVKGKGDFNFKSQTIDLVFKPRPKTPQFFSLGVPIEVSGTFNDYNVSVHAHDFLWSIARIAIYVFDKALHLINEQKIPLDGHDICVKPVEPPDN